MSDTSKPATFRHETHTRIENISLIEAVIGRRVAERDLSRLEAQGLEVSIASVDGDARVWLYVTVGETAAPERASWEVGDRVEGGAEGTDDHDTGRVIAVTAPGARAADDFGVRLLRGKPR